MPNVTNISHPRIMYKRACESAMKLSSREDYKCCSVHVNAIVGKDDTGLPTIIRYEVSDWYIEGSTVATYINGKVY